MEKEVIVFDPYVKNIFKDSVNCMVRVGERSFADEDGNEVRRIVQLDDYITVCELSNYMQRLIEGYGFRAGEQGNYDILEGEERKTFLRLVEMEAPIKGTEYEAFYGQFIDEEKYDLMRMPNRGVPMSHHDISIYKKWIEASRPKNQTDGVYYNGPFLYEY